MNDQDLARALFEAGLLTQAQIETAAAQRSEEDSFAQIIVDLGWVTAAQVRQFDPNALPDYVEPNATPLAWQMPPTSGMPGSGYSSGGYSSGDSYPVGGGYGYRPTYYPEQANGTQILILGILGAFVCALCAPMAWVQGNTALRAIDAGRADPAQRSMASIGRILGIIGTVLMIISLFFLFVLMMAGGSGRRVSNTFSPGSFSPPPNTAPPSFAPAPSSPLR